jgi:hypothetical protein
LFLKTKVSVFGFEIKSSVNPQMIAKIAKNRQKQFFAYHQFIKKLETKFSLLF